MYFVINDSVDPFFNLAMEEFLFEKAECNKINFMTLWQNSPSVIIGRFQNARQEVDLEFIAKQKLDVVRRLSGGGAVYHDLGTLNFTFISGSVSLDSGYNGTQVTKLKFQERAKSIIIALEYLGYPVTFSGRNDLLLDNSKVAGMAYYHNSRCLLEHGCILVNADLHMLGSVLRPDLEKFMSKGIKSVRSRVMNLSDYKELEVLTLKETLIKQFDLPLYELSEEDKAAVEKLAVDKYKTWNWVYGYSPTFTEHKQKRFTWGKLEVFFTVKRGKIADCSFYGDFMNELDLSILSNALKSCKYTDEAMSEKLLNCPVDRIFFNANNKEVINFLLPSY